MANLISGKWEKITMKDILEAMNSIVMSVVKEIRDLITNKSGVVLKELPDVGTKLINLTEYNISSYD